MAGMTAIPPVLVTVHDLHEHQGQLVPSGTTQVLNLAGLPEYQLDPLTAPAPDARSKTSSVLGIIALFLFTVPVTLVLKELAFAWLTHCTPFQDPLTMELMLGGMTAAGGAGVAAAIVLALAGARARERWTATVLSSWARHDADLRGLDAEATRLATKLQDSADVLNAAIRSGHLTDTNAALARGCHHGARKALGLYVDTRSPGNSPDRAEAKATALDEAGAAVELVDVIAWGVWRQQAAESVLKGSAA